ncbi:hypothetical protein GIB67_035133, partial [Kingdonia uniflora]
VQLRKDINTPGMAVLQFGYGSGLDNPHLPHNHEVDQVVYTGTYDNDTVLGWWESLKQEEKSSVPTMREMIAMWKKQNKNIFGILYTWFLAKVATKLEAFPGSEFRDAYEEAVKYDGKVILDYTKEDMGKAVAVAQGENYKKHMKEMSDVDMLTFVIQEIGKAFPTLIETLLYEQDILKHCLAQPSIRRGDGPLALVLAPTRELEQQIDKEAKAFSRSLESFRTAIVVGGINITEQAMRNLPTKHQTLLFSATMPVEIETLAQIDRLLSLLVKESNADEVLAQVTSLPESNV